MGRRETCHSSVKAEICRGGGGGGKGLARGEAIPEALGPAMESGQAKARVGVQQLHKNKLV